MLGIGAILCLNVVLAGPFSPKTMQGEFSVRAIDRGLVLPRGWLEIGLGVDHKSSSDYRDSEGQLTERSDEAVWRYRQTWLRIEQGFSPRITLYAHIPMVYANLENATGTDTTTRALGDIHMGLRIQPRTETRHHVAAIVDLKAPSGVEWPSDYIGGSSNTSSFLTGTGTTNVSSTIRTRFRIGENLALDTDLAYVHKFPAVVGYVLETDGFGNGWMNPGNEILLRASVLAQIDDRISTYLDVSSSWRLAHRVGVSGPSSRYVNLEPLEGTQSHFLDIGGGLDFALNTNLDLLTAVHTQLSGTDTRTFAHLGLEELSPQPGFTSEVELRVRW